MKIAFVTSEAYPFAKTGGLADVSYSLPVALAKMGHEVRLFMPRYYAVDKEKFGLKRIEAPLGVPFGFEIKWAALYESRYVPDFSAYFIEYDMFFGREGLYDNGYNSFEDNPQRFAFFCRAVMQSLKDLDFAPDIIHCNDWQTGLIPIYIKIINKNDQFFKSTGTVMTVHNAGYQGVFSKDNLFWIGMDLNAFYANGLEFFDQVNYLKCGILYSDIITTVSKKYALEIQTPEFGYDLAHDFLRNNRKLYGITNSVDFDSWNPGKDKYIPANYSIMDLSGKSLCKNELQRLFGLPENPGIPMLGTITRVTYQKGMDVLAGILPLLLSGEKFQFVLLGSGDEWIVNKFEQIKKMFPDSVGLRWGFDEELSHRIEAGLDIYLMPSRYEPCGLNQMYSLKYGTIPIVHATGGLDDTVEEWDADAGTGNGFKFMDLNLETLYQKTRFVIKYFQDKETWGKIQKNAMGYGYSWEDAVREYERIYSIALKEIRKN